MKISSTVNRYYLPDIIIILTAVFLLEGCVSSKPGAGIKRASYPSLASSTRTYRWLVIKCQLSDAPVIPAGLDGAIEQFFGISGAGYGNIVDYFHDVSYNHASVISDKIVGWIKVPISKADLVAGGRLASATSRKQRIQECLQAIPADQRPALDEFYGVVVINNVVQDAGAASVGQTTFTINNTNFSLAALWFDPMSLSTEFAAHEFGHGLGMGHSFDDSRRNLGGAPGEYCDPWDIMSAQLTYQFQDRNWLLAGSPSGGGPGLNAPGLLRMGWMPGANQRQFQNEGDEQTFKIRALSRPRAGEPLVVILNTGSQQAFEGIYTIEYRQGDGWDRGFIEPSAPSNVQLSGGTVLVHQFRPAGAPASTLINGAFAAALQPCNTLLLQGFGGVIFHVSVLGFDIKDGTATVSIGFGKGRFLPCSVLKNGPVDKRHIHTSPFQTVVTNPDSSPGINQ